MAFVLGTAGRLGSPTASQPPFHRSASDHHKRHRSPIVATTSGAARLGEVIGTLGGKGSTWTKEQFDRWTEMRCGKDPSRSVYWYAVGDVFAAPDGERILRIEGVDVSKSEILSETSFRSFARKIFVFRDIATGKVITEYHGKPLMPIVYTYQLRTYFLSGDGSLVAQTTFGTKDNVVTLQTDRFYWKELGNSFVATSPGFTKRGWCENYHYFVHPNDTTLTNPYQVSWTGFGPMAYIPSGSGMIETAGARFESFESLPETIREYIRHQAPMWQSPPFDEADVARLQTGADTPFT